MEILNRAIAHADHYELVIGNARAIIAKRGNLLASLKLNFEELIYFPEDNLQSYEKFCGNPFMFPWANRLESLDGQFQDTSFSIKPEITDQNGLPIHGLFTKSQDWQLLELISDSHGAQLKTKLTLDASHPAFPSFPFAQDAIVTHLLKPNRILITTKIRNTDNKPVPVSFGYHPYFNCHSAKSSETSLTLPVRSAFELDSGFLPTGRMLAVEEIWPALKSKDRLPLKGINLDYILADLQSIEGRTTFIIHLPNRNIRVHFEEGYSIAVVYTRPAENLDFICIEPMTAPTNALNLFCKGLWNDLTILKPGQEFQASFSIEE